MRFRLTCLKELIKQEIRNSLVYHYPPDATLHAEFGRIDHEAGATLVAEFGHLLLGGGGGLGGDMQFRLLRFKRVGGHYRWQGGFGSARVVERIRLTSGVAGRRLVATSVMAVRPADRVMLLLLLRRRLAGQAAISGIGAELRTFGRRSPVVPAASTIASRRITQRVPLNAGHLVRVGRIHRRGRFAHPVQLLDALHQVPLCRREIVETDTATAVASAGDGSTNTTASAIGSGGRGRRRQKRRLMSAIAGAAIV